MLVIGVLDADGKVDGPCTQELLERAGSTPVTFHRAFDEVTDQLEALDVLISAGISRVLTGGGKCTALEGVSRLAELVKHARGRIVIMAGGKVRGDVVRRIVDGSGVREVHARCESDPQRIRDIVDALA
jgi:copper homeostasis protein